MGVKHFLYAMKNEKNQKGEEDKAIQLLLLCQIKIFSNCKKHPYKHKMKNDDPT